MKLFIMSNFGHGIMVESSILPRIGDSVDLFYTPLPKVKEVILYPTEKTFPQLMKIEPEGIEAIIVVE